MIDNAVYGKCGCGHIWPVVYLPMRLDLAGEVMSSAACPKCGNSTGIKVATDKDMASAPEPRADGGSRIVHRHTKIAGGRPE